MGGESFLKKLGARTNEGPTIGGKPWIVLKKIPEMCERLAGVALKRPSMIARACSLVGYVEGAEDNDQTANRLIPVRFGNLAMPQCKLQRSIRAQIGRYRVEFVIG
jgi:hypothetical protein